MAQSSRFWDRIANRYARKPVADEAAYQRKLAVTRDYLRPDMEVLEFGSGTGSTAISHALHVRHIRAIDISEKMLDIARARAEAAGVTNVAFERADIDDLDVAAATYDVVIGLSILHLVVDKDAVIAKVHRMLKPGGVFVSSTTCLGDTMAFFKYIGPIGRAVGLMPTVKVFTVADLVDSLTRGGFAIDHQWQPGKGRAVFIVAKKAG
jgi:ubiquinone/menaquinone biosynthesis C-methylase UbiE